MRVLVISDNHSEKNILTEVYETVKPDEAIHLGDSEFPYDDEEAANTEFEVDAYDPSALPE